MLVGKTSFLSAGLGEHTEPGGPSAYGHSRTPPSQPKRQHWVPTSAGVTTQMTAGPVAARPPGAGNGHLHTCTLQCLRSSPGHFRETKSYLSRLLFFKFSVRSRNLFCITVIAHLLYTVWRVHVEESSVKTEGAWISESASIRESLSLPWIVV